MADPRSVWLGEFGADYTRRNTFTAEDLDAAYAARYGVSRRDLNREFLADLSLRTVLEVGCNVGQQLRHLREVTRADLFGVELQAAAVEAARLAVPGATILQGDARDLPFPDGHFDLVFTSGVLIHVPPADLPAVLRGIVRCSRRYVWGFEYHAEAPVEVPYRGHAGMLWKRDFRLAYQAEVPGLRLVQERFLPYRGQPLVDHMFLLEKARGA